MEFIIPHASFKTFRLHKVLKLLWHAAIQPPSFLLALLMVALLVFGSCTEALRHPFLCGPKWRVESSINMTRWSIGSTAVRIVEEYIYGAQQVI